MPTRTTAAFLTLPAAIGIAAIGVGCGHADPQIEQGRPDSGAPVTLAPKGKVLEAAENESPTVATKPQGAAAAVAGPARIDIPAGKFVAGSTPGDKGRDPALEPALLEVELGGFSIDRGLYPNDPAQPPLTGVTRARASDLCQEAGGRLCTELEWERACKGPEGTPYPGSLAWDAACAKAPASCASGFGVLGMGATLREWTASDVAPIEELQPKAAAVRGATASASGVDHRCAHRTAVDPTVSGGDVGFRCCRAAPNAASIPSPQWQQTYRRAEISAEQVAEMLTSVPQLRGLGKQIVFFKEPDDVNAVLTRSKVRLLLNRDAASQVDAAPPPNTTLTTSPLVWNPVPGEEVLVVTGKADSDAFIVAFLRLPGDRYRIASSLLLKREAGPIALGFNGYVRRRLTWATCWDCRGESGNVTYRDDNRVVITQK